MPPYFNFSQTQFPLAALLAGMVVHPETVARPPGVSVTVDTSWEELEGFAMVGGQSNKTNCALKNSLHTAFTPSPSISLPLLILLHFILLFLSLPFFPLSHSFPLPPHFSLSFPSPFPFFFFSLMPSHPSLTQILTSVHRKTLAVSKAVSIKLVSTSVTALLGTREQMQHTVVS